jgi:hypothetical protein
MSAAGNFQILEMADFGTWLEFQEITRPVRYIQNYFTLMPCYALFDGKNYQQTLNRMERYQRFDHEYDEIAQNISVFPDSTIAICRDLNKIPPGLNGTARFCVRVEYIINQLKDLQSLTDLLLDQKIFLNSLLCMKFMISPSTRSILDLPVTELVTGFRHPELKTAKS